MRSTRAVLVLLVLLLLGRSLTATAASSAARGVQLGGVTVRIGPGTTQVVTVDHSSGSHARIILWQRRSDGGWAAVLHSRSARTGYGGLVAGTRRKQGTGTTPLGTYPLLFAFGTEPRENGWKVAYRSIGPDDYWVEDNRSAYYNRYRSRAEGGFRYWLDPRSVNGSERLAAYPRQYRLALVIGYNYTHRVRYRGAGIFLHVNGSGPTSGCVSAPLWFLRGTVARLDPAAHPVIAIGR
ncbi:MAG: hypothetical protein ACJ72E_00630 [Marmoricola sp.]